MNLPRRGCRTGLSRTREIGYGGREGRRCCRPARRNSPRCGFASWRLGAAPLWLCWAALFLTSAAGAAELRSAAAKAARPADPKPAWLITESANFRVLVYGCQPASKQVCDLCETLRTELTERWLGAEAVKKAAASAWSPKCDIILHSNAAGYVQAVGPGSDATVASSLVDQNQGRIHVRRIDVRGTDPHWQTAALPHELTHVVLADRFAGQRLPRWADEGVAILADPFAKRQGHLRDLQSALANRGAFRVVELLTLDDYPPAHRWAAFYGQSASITQYLVERGDSSEQFVDFVECAMQKGYETALRDIYRINGSAELERDWNAHLRSPKANPRMSAGSEPVPAPASSSRRSSSERPS
jgi:hypothetical protein